TPRIFSAVSPAGRLFPFRLRRQPLASPTAVCNSVVPSKADDRLIRTVPFRVIPVWRRRSARRLHESPIESIRRLVLVDVDGLQIYPVHWFFVRVIVAPHQELTCRNEHHLGTVVSLLPSATAHPSAGSTPT